MPKSRLAGGSAETSRALLVDGAGGLRIEAGDGAQQGGLAAARGTEEADELALGDIETDIAQGGEVAVALGEVADFEERHRCHPEAKAEGPFPSRQRSLAALGMTRFACHLAFGADLPS